MKILVTGSEGNIGSRLVPYLESNGEEVWSLDIKQKYDPKYILCDINNLSRLYQTDITPDVVIHLAAMVSRVTCEDSPELTIQTNVAGTNNIIQYCKHVGAKLIYFSTSEIYGNTFGVLHEDRQEIRPNNLYGQSKWIGEQLVRYERTNGLKATIVRPFMFYDENETFGTNRSAMIRFAESLVKGEKITVHKDSNRSWMHISDAVKVITEICYRDIDTINIGNPEVIKTSELAKHMCLLLSLDYDKYVEEIGLPDKMTLRKEPGLALQESLGMPTLMGIRTGIALVLQKVQQRLDK
jgi:nucleoside-diphosphate-sugar epimerase